MVGPGLVKGKIRKSYFIYLFTLVIHFSHLSADVINSGPTVLVGVFLHFLFCFAYSFAFASLPYNCY